MKFRLLLLLCIALIGCSDPVIKKYAPVKSHKEYIKTTSIDSLLHECQVNQHKVTNSIGNCYEIVLHESDRRLNFNYNSIMEKSLSDSSKSFLKKSQRIWLKYRDTEFLFIESKYEGLDGTMWSGIMYMEKIDIVRHRFEELKDYNGMLETME